MGIFKTNTPSVKEMNMIVDKMEKAIADCKSAIINKNDLARKYAVNKLSEKINDIADTIIKNMNATENTLAKSDTFYIADLFEIDKEDVNGFIKAIRYNNNNVFADYLKANNLTMARDLHTGSKVQFAYGQHAYFSSGWEEICGLEA